MSHQPSTVEQIRTTAAQATHTVAQTLDPNPEHEATGWRTDQSIKDSRQSPDKHKGSYQEQLGEAAKGGPDSVRNKESVVSKAMAYVPGGAALEKAVFGATETDMKAARGEVRDDGTPPTRPMNDTQIEEFLKTQYKSKPGDGVPKESDDVTDHVSQ